MTDFNKLQNGNMICGDVGPKAAEETKISKETSGQIVGAFTYWLSQKVQKNPIMLNICVGRDNSPFSEEPAEGAFEAMGLWGASIHDAGIATCEAVAKAPVLPCYELDASIMIAAGEKSEDTISFRFFGADGEPTEDDIKEILRLASRYNFIGGEYEKNEINLMQMYEVYGRQNPDFK